VGNWWSNYNGIDDDGNGIGDTPYEIDGNGNATDRYPLILLDDSNTWIVDDDNGSWADFEHIQDAINASNDGDTILVYEGTYYEHDIIVNRTLTIIGNGTEDSIVDSEYIWDSLWVISLENDSCEISGLHLYHNFGDGLCVNSNNNTIHDMLVTAVDWEGIDLVGVDGNLIFNCTVTTTHTGISLHNSTNTTVSGCWLYGNDANGIRLKWSNANEIFDNNCSDNGVNGAFLSDSLNNSISWTVFLGNLIGVSVDDNSDGNSFDQCEMNDNDFGINVSHSAGTMIENCTVLNNVDVDITLKNDTNVILLDVPFETVTVIENSRLTVRNYLHIHVVNETNGSMEGVDLSVLDGNDTVYSTEGYGGTDQRTGDDGRVGWIVVTDRVYESSSNATENATTVEAKFGNWTESRSIDMFSSHTEEFVYSPPHVGPVWYVDDDNVNDTETDGSEAHPFDTILKAMENATTNHTIRVWAGTYNENVTINHTGLSMIGNGSSNTTIIGLGTGDVIWMNVSNIVIEGFRVNGSGSAAEDAAIDLNGQSNIIIREVVVAGSEYGIFLDGSFNASIINSTAEDNSFGVRAEGSNWVNITNLDVLMNTNTGLLISDTENLTIVGGLIEANTNDGIHLENSDGAYISGVTVRDHSDDGIEISNSDAVTVSGCTLVNNTFGIFASQSLLLQVISTSVSDSSNDALGFTLLSDYFLVEMCEISDSSRGISVDSTIGGRIGNTTISGSSSTDLSATTTASATTFNATFTSVSCDFTSTLTVNNYLRIRVMNQYNEPWNGADVNITDNDESVYASLGYNGTDPKTAKNGYIDWVLVTDRIYDGSSTATENETIAYAIAEGNEGNLTINMSWSHIEELVINLSEEGILYVDEDNVGDPDMDGSRVHPYDTIQRGIDNATEDGMTIRIWEGVYREHVNVSRSMTLLGNGSISVIDATGDGNAIIINADNITLERLNLTNGKDHFGIWFEEHDLLNVVDCNISGFNLGIALSQFTDVTVESSWIFDCRYGVYSEAGDNLSVLNSTIANCAYYGIYGWNMTSIIILDSNFTRNEDGILLEKSSRISVEWCRFNRSTYGAIEANWNITLLSVQNCTIDGAGSEYGLNVGGDRIHLANITIDAPDQGIRLYRSTNSSVTDVGIMDSDYGLEVFNSDNIDISRVNITGSTQGIYLMFANNCVLDSNSVSTSDYGLILMGSSSVTMRDNKMHSNEYNFGVDGYDQNHFFHDIDTSNTVNSEPIMYLVNVTGHTYLNGTFGFIGVVNTNADIDAEVHRNLEGVLVAYCDGVNVTGDYSDNFAGIYIINSTSIDISSVDHSGSNISIVVSSSSWVNVTIVRSDSIVNGTFIYYSNNITVSESDMTCSEGGFQILDSQDIFIENVTIDSKLDMTLERSNVTALNVTIDVSSVRVEENSTLTVRNYLHVHVNDTIGQDLAGADVQIKDNDDIIYASAGYGGSDSQTDSEGYVRWIIVTDRIYNGSDSATENTTTLDVKTHQWSEQRDVDMSSTHTEWFDEVEPANKKPFVQIFDPEDGASISRSSTKLIIGNASDDDGEIFQVEIRFDSETSWQACQGTRDWNYDWDTQLYSAGQHQIHVRSQDDKTAYSDVFSITVTLIDNQSPNCTITAPEHGVYVNGTVTVTGRADDPEGDMDEVEIAIVLEGQTPGSGDWVQADDTSGNSSWYSWEFEWDTLEPNRTDDGVYDIYARSRDGENLTRTDMINVSLDNPDDPTILLREPKKDVELTGTVTLNGTAKDPDHDGNVTDVYVAFTERGVEPEGSDWLDADDTSGSKDAYWFWEFVWGTTDLEDGNYTIHAMSYDGGNISEVLKRNVSIDNINTLPRTYVTYPDDGSDLSGEVKITGYTIDPDDELNSVDVTIFKIIDNQTVDTTTLYTPIQKVAWNRWNWSVNWDTRDEDEGNYTIQANSTDRRDELSNEWLVNVTVWKNVPPWIKFTNPDGIDDTVWKGDQTWFFIQWEDEDPDDNATIKLYYDDDNEGFDGTKLHSGAFHEDSLDNNSQEKDSYRWDVTDMPEDDYWLYAVIEDGVNAHPTKRYAKHVLPIREGTPNVPPTIVIDHPNGTADMIDPGDEYVIHFNASDEDGDDLDILLFYDTDNIRSNDGYTQINDVAVTQLRTEYKWDTDGVEKGNYYILFLLDDGENEAWFYSDGTITIGDVITPSAIGSPEARDLGFGDSLNLTWYAPGDDGDVGQATAYFIRYDNEEITTEGRWDSAFEVINSMVPKEPGEPEWVHVVVPDNSTVYHYAVRAVDDEGNFGPIVSMSNTTSLVEGLFEFELSGGFSVKLTWIGHGSVVGVDAYYDLDLPQGLVSIDAYVSLSLTDGEVRDLRMEITYPSSLDGTNGIENARVYHQIGGSGWELIESSGTDTGERLIYADIDDMSLFGIFIPISEPPKLGSVTYSPDFPDEDDDITFTVVYTYELDKLPTDVFLFIDNEMYKMELFNGTPLDGAFYQVKVKLSKGEHDVIVKAYGEPFDEITTVETTIYVEEAEEDKEFPIMIVAGIVAVIVVVILLLVVSKKRKRTRAAEAAKEPAKMAPVNVIEAEVYEAVVEFEGPPAFTEDETKPAEETAEPAPAPQVDGAPPPSAVEEVQPAAEAVPVPAEAAEATPPGVAGEVPPVRAAEPVPAVAPAIPIPVVPPPRLQLPKVPGAAPRKRPKQEKPVAIEAEVMDIGKIMVAPCPTCGHSLIIPKVRPVDIKCPGCEDEFTIQ